jgi:hypothetical protein
MSVGPKYGFFGLRLSQMRHRSVTLCMMRCCIKHVSRVGTHRSNEWEGRHGGWASVHAARDRNWIDGVIKRIKIIVNNGLRPFGKLRMSIRVIYPLR